MTDDRERLNNLNFGTAAYSVILCPMIWAGISVTSSETEDIHVLSPLSPLVRRQGIISQRSLNELRTGSSVFFLEGQRGTTHSFWLPSPYSLKSITCNPGPPLPWAHLVTAAVFKFEA